MSDRNSGFMGGLVVGLVVGGLLALLYAPEKGAKTRKQLSKRRDELKGKATEALGSATDAVDKGRKKMGI